MSLRDKSSLFVIVILGDCDADFFLKDVTVNRFVSAK